MKWNCHSPTSQSCDDRDSVGFPRSSYGCQENFVEYGELLSKLVSNERRISLDSDGDFSLNCPVGIGWRGKRSNVVFGHPRNHKRRRRRRSRNSTLRQGFTSFLRHSSTRRTTSIERSNPIVCWSMTNVERLFVINTKHCHSTSHLRLHSKSRSRSRSRQAMNRIRPLIYGSK
jgi:hypothetical protein